MIDVEFDNKRKKVQQIYQETLQKKEKKHTVEVIVVVTFFVLIFSLNLIFKGF